MVNPKAVDAFHLMWDNFPTPVRLIHRNRTVLAVNEASRKMGWVEGVPCFAAGNPESHKACKANEALATFTGQSLQVDGNRIKFWIPVKDCPDIFVHFNITTSSIEVFTKSS
jgi:hypothetical protein